MWLGYPSHRAATLRQLHQAVPLFRTSNFGRIHMTEPLRKFSFLQGILVISRSCSKRIVKIYLRDSHIFHSLICDVSLSRFSGKSS